MTILLVVAIYFIPSVGLTFYQRWLLQRLHFPLLISSTHLAVKFLLAVFIRVILQLRIKTVKLEIPWRTTIRQLAPQGLAAGLDIALSNWGLALVTVSLYTMTKTTSIVFILFFSLIFRLEQKSWRLFLIVLMISIGLFMFTYKATQFSLFGFFLVLLATFISGLRWTLAQLLMQKSQLGLENPIDMMYHVQPWMLVPVLPLALIFEGPRAFGACASTLQTISSVLLGALMAFCMEAAEFLLVSTTSSLSLSVVGMLKEVVILVLAVEWNGDEMGKVNILGLCLCIAGMCLHIISKASQSRDRIDGLRATDHKPLLVENHVERDSESGSEESDIVFTASNALRFNETASKEESNRSFWRKDLWH